MTVIWLNGTVGAGKSAVGEALADILPGAVFMDGDDHAGPPGLPTPLRWRMALDVLLWAVARSRPTPILVIAYPLEMTGHARLRAVCGRAHRFLAVVNLAPPLPMTLCGRGGRELDKEELAQVRVMRSEGYHRRRFALFTLPNAHFPVARTAWRIVRRLKWRMNPGTRCCVFEKDYAVFPDAPEWPYH